MLERDYLMRIVLQFVEAIRRSWTKDKDERDPKGAADMLENAIGDATDIDGGVLLSLAPESIASVMQVSGVDPRVTGYIARSLLLASSYMREAGDHALADVREAQARAIAEAYGLSIPEDVEDVEGLFDEIDLRSTKTTETVSAPNVVDDEPVPATSSVVIVRDVGTEPLPSENAMDDQRQQKRQE